MCLCFPSGQVHCAQYLHSITQNLSRFYICRHESCMFFGLNTEWVPNQWGGRFRCPACGQLHRPGKQMTTYIDAQHVWVLQSPGAPTYYMLGIWPETAEENWITKMMDSEAGA